MSAHDFMLDAIACNLSYAAYVECAEMEGVPYLSEDVYRHYSR